MKHRPIALSLVFPLALLGAAAFTPSAPAQRGGFASAAAGRGFAAGRSGAVAVRGGVRAGAVRARPRGTGRYNAGLGYGGYGYLPFFDDYGPDYDTELAPESPAQQVIGVQTAPASSPASPPARPAEPLVLELQGDRWVRITPYGSPQTVSQASGQASPPLPQRASPATAAPARAQAAAASPPAPPAPAVLVFRDGHQEQIGQYRIMGGTIYINSDYWTSGVWTRSVPIADLDVPATLKLNQQRGANFRLPSSPDEVMIGG